ncbi:unnamed protein product [Larinioides sclopetarius]|uniref:Fatty acid hydroxylase domain-containing protein n=1 Tax=Larinioides sclopetarius TaxID=280406 RepID=A0AAV2B0M1_9ARAC
MLNENHQQVLETPSSFWQTQWDTVWEWSGSNEFNLVRWGTFIYTTAIFWIAALGFLMIDLTGKPKVLQKYRIQKTSKYQVKFMDVLKAAKQILFNQLLCGIPSGILYYHVLIWRGYDSSRNLPTFSRITLEIAFSILLQEIVYYYIHRFLHTPFLFKYVHYLHHKWNSPIAIIAELCHPLENFFANLFPIVLGPILLGSHLATSWIWYAIAIISTMISHSGFHIPQIPNPEIHDIHHSKHNRNYGVLGIMDRIHGTFEVPRVGKIQ